MKKQLLVLCFLAISHLGNSQNCIKILDSTINNDLKKLSEIIMGGFSSKDSLGVTPVSEDVIFQIKIVDRIVTEVVALRSDKTLLPNTIRKAISLVEQKWKPEGIINSSVVYPIKITFGTRSSVGEKRIFLSDYFEKNCEINGVLFYGGVAFVYFLQVPEDRIR